MVKNAPKPNRVNEPHPFMIEKLIEKAKLEAKRQKVPIAVVKENGKLWLWRYDWLCLAQEREKRKTMADPDQNMLKNLTVEYIALCE